MSLQLFASHLTCIILNPPNNKGVVPLTLTLLKKQIIDLTAIG